MVLTWERHTKQKTQPRILLTSLLPTSVKSLCYSFIMDGSTDAGNVEDELIVISYCLKNDKRFIHVQGISQFKCLRKLIVKA